MIACAVEVAVADDVRYLSCIYVDERHRKLGFARRMITTAQAIGDRHNADSITALDTYTFLESMYEKFDFKTVCMLFDYEGTVSACVHRSRFGTDVREVQALSCAMHCAAIFYFVVFTAMQHWTIVLKYIMTFL